MLNWIYEVYIGQFNHNHTYLGTFTSLPEARKYVKDYKGDGKPHLCIIAKNMDAPFNQDNIIGIMGEKL